MLHEGLLGVFDDQLIEQDYDDIEEKKYTVNAKTGWLGLTAKYWITSLVPEKNKEFNPPIECKFKLSGNQVRQKMQKKLDELYNNKKILDHGMVVGKELAYVLSGGDTD